MGDIMAMANQTSLLQWGDKYSFGSSGTQALRFNKVSSFASRVDFTTGPVPNSVAIGEYRWVTANQT